MSEIQLFEHNEEAVRDMLKGLEESNFAFMERATGTGKSMILIKLMDELMHKKRVLFVTLHEAMYNQLLNRDMISCGISKEDFPQLDCMLYASIPKHTADWYYENYDYFIFDEAQHCGSPIWGEIIGKLSELVGNSEDKKMIGATATRTRYLDDYKDVCREYFDNNLVNRLDLSEAILRELLPAPKYINLNKTAEDTIKRIKKKLDQLKEYEELEHFRYEVDKASEDLLILSPAALLKEYGAAPGEKYIVFCKNIDDIKLKMKEVDTWFKDIAPVSKYSVHSHQGNTINQNQIDSFENDDDKEHVKVMFAVDMFNEGLHIKGVDAIIMTRSTTSPILYLQQLGRALSYSVRKKQITIFDLAGNATEIDIINNLYKELLKEARDNLKNGVGDPELYEQIIDRFEIVDRGTSENDSLLMIEKYIDDNYINARKVIMLVDILCNFANSIDGNFMELLKANKIDKEHVDNYKTLQRLSNIIPYSDLVRLSTCGILVSEEIQLNPEVLEKVKISGNYKNVRDNELKDFMFKYNSFYLTNNRRALDFTDEEIELNNRYRTYLATLRKAEIKSVLSSAAYPLNVEELILLNEYPDQDDINEYLDNIEEKYIEGIPLDDLEFKVVDKANRMMNLKQRPVIKVMLSKETIALDEAIKVLAQYKDLYPQETFENREMFTFNGDINDALNTLYEYAERVTNLQFEKLLSLGIKLPEKIDMPLEKRLQLLGDYQTLYEKRTNEERTSLNIVLSFIKENKRRPDEEKDINEYKALNGLLRQRKFTTLIYRAFEENGIEISVEEKEKYYNSAITKDDLRVLYKGLLNSLRNVDVDNFDKDYNMRNRINILYNHHAFSEKFRNIMLDTIKVVAKILSDKSSRGLETYLVNKQGLIPFCLKDYLKEKYDLEYSIFEYADGKSINYAHHEFLQDQDMLKRYFQYIKEHGKRPDLDSDLQQDFRDYLAISDTKEINRVVRQINGLKMPITLYELYLIGGCSEKAEKDLFAFIKNKDRLRLEGKYEFDLLDEVIYGKINPKYEYGLNDTTFEKEDTSSEYLNRKLSSERLERIFKQIEENPLQELSINTCEFSHTELRAIEKKRKMLYSSKFFERVIEQMKETGKAYTEILNEEEIKELNSLIESCRKVHVNAILIRDLINLNRKNALLSSNIDINNFLYNYIEYIKEYKEKPNENSDDIGLDLFNKYKILREVLSKEEISKIDREISNELKLIKNVDFFDRYVDFVNTNQRLPYVYSTNPDEVNLAREYLGRLGVLSEEQKKVISELNQLYGDASKNDRQTNYIIGF